ncbi:unnamed protein product [Allacma fusca]|uniref:F-box domain-containing protein n=1 Tax=Allacma fusca TaxID=39272 RepID=A0A8J2LG89_9HEXA|nr:unnamed protein product [Allacma fusca]
METFGEQEDGTCGSSSIDTFGKVPCQKDPAPEDICNRIMAVDLILHSIFQYLKGQDLKSCSLVSKRWARAARLTMHKYYEYRVDLMISKGAESSIKEFLKLVQESSTTLPFNTFSIRLQHNIFHASDYDNCQERIGDYLASFEHWDKLKIKKLHVQDNSIHHPQCNLLSSMKVMFQKISPNLKYLKANVRCFNLMFKDHRRNLVLQNLTSLDVDLDPNDRDLMSFIETFLQGGAPLLRELLGKLHQEFVHHFTENDKGYLIKNCDFTSSLTTADLEKIFAFAMDPLVNLQRFSILGCANPTDSRNIFEHIIELLLNNSEDSLREMRSNLGIINFISKIRTRPLKNLERLDLLFGKVEFRGDGLLPAIPFAKLFPNLKYVHIFDAPSINIVDIIPDSFLVPDQMVTSFCPTVEEITFESTCESLKRPFMYALWKIFPNVKQFSYVKPPSLIFNAPEILIRSWHFLFTERIWPALETVRVNADSLEIKCLEPYILGVSEDEVQYWRSGDYGYMNMRKFQYAPSRVYILHRRELRKVIFGIYNGYEGLRPFRYADSCAFSRKPELSVVIQLLDKVQK